MLLKSLTLDFRIQRGHTLCMTEQLPTHNDYGTNFYGKHIDIQLLDDKTLTEQLETRDRIRTYIDVEDEDILPYPARQVKLESYHDIGLDTLRIQGEVSFRPTDLQNMPDTWPGMFLQELQNSFQNYGYEIAYQEHDMAALYISLDVTHSIRIALSSTAVECAIDVELLTTTEIENATHNPLPEPYADRDLTYLEKFRHILTALGVTLDSLREYYGAPPMYHGRYTLKQYQASKELVLPSPTVQVSGQPHASEMTAETQAVNYGLESFGGAKHAKNRLYEFAAIMNNPDEASEFDIQRSHFLLYGPPGTGKTTLITAFANEIGATLWAVSSTDLVDMWVGNSGKNVVKTFEKAKKVAGKVVVFFDEFDALAQKGGRGGGERSDVRKILNTQLEDIAKNYPNIIVAAATNADLDDLEPSLIRSGRIEPIGMPVPTEEERYDVLGTVLFKSIQRTMQDKELVYDEKSMFQPSETFVLYDQSIDIDELVRHTDGMTGADFEVILERARKKHFMRFKETGEKNPVTQQDLLREIREFGR